MFRRVILASDPNIIAGECSTPTRHALGYRTDWVYSRRSAMPCHEHNLIMTLTNDYVLALKSWSCGGIDLPEYDVFSYGDVMR